MLFFVKKKEETTILLFSLFRGFKYFNTYTNFHFLHCFYLTKVYVKLEGNLCLLEFHISSTLTICFCLCMNCEMFPVSFFSCIVLIFFDEFLISLQNLFLTVTRNSLNKCIDLFSNTASHCFLWYHIFECSTDNVVSSMFLSSFSLPQTQRCFLGVFAIGRQLSISHLNMFLNFLRALLLSNLQFILIPLFLFTVWASFNVFWGNLLNLLKSTKPICILIIALFKDCTEWQGMFSRVIGVDRRLSNLQLCLKIEGVCALWR